MFCVHRGINITIILYFSLLLEVWKIADLVAVLLKNLVSDSQLLFKR